MMHASHGRSVIGMSVAALLVTISAPAIAQSNMTQDKKFKVGMAVGGVNFADLSVSLGTSPAGEPVLVKYGAFLQTVFDFLIIALAIFMAIKAVNKLRAAPAAPATPADVALLTEIRDLLKKQV